MSSISEKRLRTEYQVHEEQARVIVDIFTLYVNGVGVRGIAKSLNDRSVPCPRVGGRGTGSWGPSQVWEILRRERYIGILRYGKTQKGYRKGTKVRTRRSLDQVDPPIERPELRIVPQDLWDAALAKRSPRTTKPWNTAKGRKPSHLLTGLGVCSQCGGGIKARSSRFGKDPVKVYHCGYHHDRGNAVCTNTLRRPVAEIDSLVLSWITKRFLTDDMIRLVMKTLRERIEERSTANTSSEIPGLEEQSAQLSKEIENLAEAVATTSGKVDVLAVKLAERQERLRAIEARLSTLKVAPEVFSLELRRLEKDALARLPDLRAAFNDAPHQSRQLLEWLLQGKLTFTPIETAEGKRYKVECDGTGYRIVSGTAKRIGLRSAKRIRPGTAKRIRPL